MPATPWTELTGTASAWTEGVPGGGVEGFSMFGLVIPVEGGVAFQDPTASWTEVTAPATSYAEVTAPPVSWTELTG